jgi:hypothetical protein
MEISREASMMYGSEMIKDCQRTAATTKIAELRGIYASAMRDADLMVIDAITDDAIQTVFESLDDLLDIAESAIRRSDVDERARNWFKDQIAALAK